MGCKTHRHGYIRGRLIVAMLPLPLSCCPVVPELCSHTLEGLRTELVYERSGGFTGTGERIVISRTGLLNVTGRSWFDTSRPLSSDEAVQLLNLLIGWDSLAVHPEPNQCADVFQHAITYDGRTLTWTDCTQSVPEELRLLSELLLGL
jgi:hypothetical protein